MELSTTLKLQLLLSNTRTEAIQYVGCENPNDPSDLIVDWFNDFGHEEPDFIVGERNWLLDTPEDERHPAEDLSLFLERYQPKGGFIGMMARQVPHSVLFRGDGTVHSYQSSWAMYWTKLFYAPTLESLYQAGLEWGNKKFDEEVQSVKAREKKQ